MYFGAGFFYMCFGSGKRQSWDSPSTGENISSSQTEDLEMIDLKEIVKLPDP